MSNSSNNANSQSGAAAAPQASTPGADEPLAAALRERFDIVAKLTESDAHSVYLVRDLSRSKNDTGAAEHFRLKVLSPALAADDRQVELFYLESLAAAALSHKNILTTAEAEEMNGVHFCLMEERPGLITLRDCLKRKAWLDADEAAQIVRQVADALEHAHERGVLHLALEPEKILLDSEGAAFVTGFGIGRAKHLMWARQQRSHYCDMRYISPEQILSAEVDQRSDLYLLGLIFFEMLTDRAPFETEDMASLKLKHLTWTAPPPHKLRQELSMALSGLVMDLLAKRPDGRPFNVAAFKSALEQCVSVGLTADEEEDGKAILFHPPVLQPAPSQEPALFEQPPQGSPQALPQGAAQEDIQEDVFEESLDSPADAPIAFEREQRESIQREAIHAAPVFLPQAAGEARPRRFVLLLALLLLAGGIGGLLWAMRASQSQSTDATTAAPSAAAQPQSAGESNASNAQAPAASKPEAASAGAASAGAAAESSPDSLSSFTVIGRAADGERGHAAATQLKRPAEVVAGRLSPPRRAGIAPPEVSAIGPVFVPKTGAAPELKAHAPTSAQDQAPAPAPPVRMEPTAAVTAPATRIIRKPGDVLQNTAIMRASPVYPKAVRAAGVKGAVTVEVIIDEEGSVIAARPVAGPEELREAALAAARRWKWTPTRVDRNRVKVVGTITLAFR